MLPDVCVLHLTRALTTLREAQLVSDMLSRFLLLTLLFLPSLLTAQSTGHLKTVTLPTFTVDQGSGEHAFLYSNRSDAYFLGVLNGENSSACHGILAGGKKVFENYWIMIGDRLLDRSRCSISVTPAGFVRSYALGNTKEYVSFSDSITLLSISVRTDLRDEVRIYPGWSSTWTNTVESHGSGMYTLRDDRLRASVMVQGLEGSWEVARSRDLQRILPPIAVHVPAVFTGSGNGTFHCTIEVATAASHLQARPPQELFRISKRKQLDLTDFLSGINFSCSDSLTEAAFGWIAAALRARRAEAAQWQTKNESPDACTLRIANACLDDAEALLSIGRFDEVRDILHAGLKRIDRDSSSGTFGFLPVSDSLALCREITSKLLAAVGAYQRVSGDSSLANASGSEDFPSAAAIMKLIDRGLLDSAWTITKACAGRILEYPFGQTAKSDGVFDSSLDVCGACVHPSPAGTGNHGFLHTMIAGYAGVHRSIDGEGPAITLAPRLPVQVTDLAFNTRVGSCVVHLRYRRSSATSLRCTVSMKSGSASIRFRPASSPRAGEMRFDSFILESGTSHSFVLTH
jgi:hypothetical protein